MKNPINFVPSNSSMRERQMLATPAGFFCFQQKGFKPYDKRPAITEPQREVTLAQADCWTAVIGGPLFCPPTNVQQYALPHRNFRAQRGQNPTRTAHFIRTERTGNGTPPHLAPRTFPYPAGLQSAGNTRLETPIIRLHSVT